MNSSDKYVTNKNLKAFSRGSRCLRETFLFATWFAEFWWENVKINLVNILFIYFYDSYLSFRENLHYVTFFSVNFNKAQNYKSHQLFLLEQMQKEIWNHWNIPNHPMMNDFLIFFVSSSDDFPVVVSTSNIPENCKISMFRAK